ncbi:histidinol dehydrogenase [Candidatus Nitrosotenuis cloacae]|uniref:histidinol dehydrogenase n=1 Tax=Candidatus Nitrosotenuis cloacae TaxID=1603555 RepID=UPI002281EB7F|nr:histidinol dehydrogenase [Candidatus Nitrosotenuis cloacae]
MKVIRVKNADSFARPKEPSYNKKLVESIIDQVRKSGDTALRKFEAKFNGVSIKTLQVSKKEIHDAYQSVTREQMTAISMAKDNLARTELALKKQLKEIRIDSNGIKIVKSFSALDCVGCYVPGGLARYPSSAVMSVVPAKVAGVQKIIVVTPPNKQGGVDPTVLVAADMCGADLIFKVGGAHAIAALAYGTKSIPPVDKIVGPGGPFVTAAKYLVSSVTSIDMLAGPTELAIIADDSADPEFVALDLISQSEHSADTTCCLITTSKKLADSVNEIITKSTSIQRKEIVLSSLNKNGFVALCDKMSDAINVANKLAPEHLEIITRQPQKLAKQIKSAGLILLGKNTPSAASDYLLGTNHVLPTNRFGKSRGSLSVLDFMKIQTTVESSRNALERIDKKLETLTTSESLPNHYLAVRKRL